MIINVYSRDSKLKNNNQVQNNNLGFEKNNTLPILSNKNDVFL